ncbi:hypothetical protein KGA66_13265 [Actinocrinis puniceicyclus]|uniref:Hydrolytic protein n=1 Tax=Actinocrinis puniceicyclus TaxID=977794 RepID=A0A8J7WR48_9ACTN|nr:hypothetical protein [Actinocrinis puniceicyclus]MBS2964020.1 hypothetical protein [Actinocrinis puniceicyclus]
MGAEASLTPAALPVIPGEEAEVELTVTNTGTVVDSFTLQVLGEPAAWAAVEPATLSLFPGQSESAKLRLRPPLDPKLAPGPRPYAVRISANEDPQHPCIEEGVVSLAGKALLSADLSPRTGRARGRRAGRFQVALDNRGNAPVLVDLTGFDAQDLVDVTVQPPRIEVGPGAAAFVTARARARTRFWRGPSVLHRFTVAARPAEQAHNPDAQSPDAQSPVGQGPAGQSPHGPSRADAPAPLEASLLQEAAVPAWVGKALALAVLAAVALTALWFTVLKPVVRDAATGAANQALTAAGLTPGGGAGSAAGAGAAGGASPSGSGGAGGSSPAAGSSASASASPAASAHASPPGPVLPAPVAFAVDLKANGSLTAGTHQLYTVTDLVLQNPNGDTGSLTITRGGNTLISTRMENFRDYDLHFVTAITVGAGQSLNISVNCDKPGGTAASCTPAVLVSGLSHTVA